MKKLSNADLGSSASENRSHQTHLGLDELAFRFLNPICDVSLAYFYYDGNLSRHIINYGLITPKTTPRSPHLNKGSEKDDTIYQSIYATTHNSDSVHRWYLLWATLVTDTPVFVLFDEDSPILSYFVGRGLYNPCAETEKRNRMVHIETDEPEFIPLVRFVESFLNVSKFSEIPNDVSDSENAEISATSKRNMSAVRKNIEKIGRMGEELVDRYLSKLCSEGKIESYSWMNKNGESYMPFDFSMSMNKCIYYIDVKTSGGDFDNPIFFSSNEIEFIKNHQQYSIYRVYRQENEFSLSVCSSARNHFSELYKFIENFKNISKQYADITEVTVSIKPSEHSDLIFDGEIDLDPIPTGIEFDPSE